MKKKPLTNKKGEVRELTAEDIRSMRPMEKVLSPRLVAIIKKRKRGERGLQKKPIKVPVTIRINHEVVKYFQSEGHGWQTRMNNALEVWVKKHPQHVKHSKKVA